MMKEALAVNVIRRRGTSNKMHHWIQPKKTKISKSLLVVNITVKPLCTLYITNKTECFSLKVGVSYELQSFKKRLVYSVALK